MEQDEYLTAFMSDSSFMEEQKLMFEELQKQKNLVENTSGTKNGSP